MKIAVAQINSVTGDLKGNFLKISENIRIAKENNADIVVFPETAITGYCCGALFEYEDFIRENLRILHDDIASIVPDDLIVIIGFVDLKKSEDILSITNSVALIKNGKVQDSYDKIFLANRDHHEDRKYFIPGKKVTVFETEIKGKKIKIGTPICEDAWENNDRDVIAEMKSQGADIIISVNNSYFCFGKQKKRVEVFGGHAKRHNIPIVMVNTVGVGDIVKNIIIYDGSSLVFNRNGEIIAASDRFKEDLKIVEICLNGENVSKEIEFQDKYEEIFNALVYEQKELFRVLGITNAQVHMSGGIDSAIVAAIAVLALGPGRVVLISNPTEDNKSITKGFAAAVAENLNCSLYWNSTQEIYEETVKQHNKAFHKDADLGARACMQAVLRTAQGISATHTFKSGIVSTGNHTEFVLGWTTFHDIGSVGVHAPLGDLTKVELYKLSEYINEYCNKEIIPEDLYNGNFKPSAELADSSEDPIDYFVMSGICAEIIRERKTIKQLVREYDQRSLDPELFPLNNENLSVYDAYSKQEFTCLVEQAFQKAKISVFKCAQSAPIVIISPRSRGFSSRETIINKYVE